MARGRPSRQAVYALLDEAIEDLRVRMGGLPSPAEAEEIWSDLWHQEAHHSTALEGNTLILNEVRKNWVADYQRSKHKRASAPTGDTRS